MAVEERDAAAPARAGIETQWHRRLLAGGTAGNERLTELSGGALIVLLAVLGVTIIDLRGLLWLHLFLGILLIGPVALKMAVTGYRFARYYSHEPRYRAKGPPPAALRAIAPIVVLTTLLVFASGVALLFIGHTSRDTLLPLHKISFIVWVVFTALHVLAHLPPMAGAVAAELQARADVPGRSGRGIVLAGALVGGAVLAILVVPQFADWIHHPHGLQRGG